MKTSNLHAQLNTVVIVVLAISLFASVFGNLALIDGNTRLIKGNTENISLLTELATKIVDIIVSEEVYLNTDKMDGARLWIIDGDTDYEESSE